MLHGVCVVSIVLNRSMLLCDNSKVVVLKDFAFDCYGKHGSVWNLLDFKISLQMLMIICVFFTISKT